ncbi:MAG TPA: hypothetical protein VH138_00795 [Vicinamibacterales bacterium]|nr:hypothetical protein [Vicinamibacterales bacterium]
MASQSKETGMSLSGESNPRAIKGFDANAMENVPVKDVKSACLFAFAHSRPGNGAFRPTISENRPQSRKVSSFARGAPFAI